MKNKYSNIWEAICTPELEKILMSCPEWESLGDHASDFERFEMFLDCLPYISACKCTTAAVNILKNIVFGCENIGHICCCDAAELWRAYTESSKTYYDEKLYNYLYKKIEKSVSKNIINSDDVTKLSEKDFCGFKSLDEYYSSFIERLNYKNNTIMVTFEQEDFIRPNFYLSGQEFNSFINSEKCEKIKSNLIKSQIICQIIYDGKSNHFNDVKFILDGDARYIEQLLEYFSLRNFAPQIFVNADALYSLQDLPAIFSNSNIRPLIKYIPNRLWDRLSAGDFEYPVSGMYFLCDGEQNRRCACEDTVSNIISRMNKKTAT